MASGLLDKKEVRIRRMFGDIAPWYDFLNHVLSCNIDRYWRWRTTRLVPAGDGPPILDLCTGTGDLALAYHRTVRSADIIACDFCHPMLIRAGAKVTKRLAADRIQIVEADAQNLPYSDAIFQIATVAFGLRNVTDFRRGLAEMIRVVRPGGQVAVLEFSKPRHWLFGRAYRFYFRHILPKIGQLFSRSRDSAYQYLPASVLEFPDYEALLDEMAQLGLQDVRYHTMTFGIATLYVGTKP